MRPTRSVSMLSLSIAAASLWHAPSALAQTDDAALDIRFAGLDQIQPDEKDRAAYDALRHIGARLAELPEELEGDEDVKPAIQAAWHGFMGEWGMRVAPGAGPMGLGSAFWTEPMDPMSAERWAEILTSLLEEEVGVPVEAGEGGWTIMTPTGPVAIMLDGNGPESRTVISLGLDDFEPGGVQRFDLPADASPILSASFNLRSVGGLLNMAAMGGDPAILPMFEEFGITGPNAWAVDSAVGVTPDELVYTARMHDAKSLYANMGVDPEAGFDSDDLRAIPHDATIAMAVPFSLETMLFSLDMAEAQTGQDILEEIDENTGVDIRATIIENFGPRAMYYQSDSTGGGGLMSAVLIMELRDAEAFARTQQTFGQIVTDLLEENARGYAGFREREIQGRTVHSFMTPGIPLPIELAWTLTDGRLVIAATPAAMTHALAQLDGGLPSILDNVSFREHLLDRMGESFVSMSFMDSPRLVGRGYAAAQLLLTGLANGVASPGGEDRLTDGVLLPYAQFVQGVHPMTSLMTWDGEDAMVRGWADRSMMVNFGTLASQSTGYQGAIAVAGLGTGILLPALGQARESAQQLKSATQVRGLVQAMMLFSQNNNDRYPRSVDQLIEAGLLPEEMLASPMGDAWDGGPGIGMRNLYPDGGGEMSFDTREILAVDRVMYLQGRGEVNVGFGDGRVELLDIWDIDELLEEPINMGARESLGLE